MGIDFDRENITPTNRLQFFSFLRNKELSVVLNELGYSHFSIQGLTVGTLKYTEDIIDELSEVLNIDNEVLLGKKKIVLDDEMKARLATDTKNNLTAFLKGFIDNIDTGFEEI